MLGVGRDGPLGDAPLGDVPPDQGSLGDGPRAEHTAAMLLMSVEGLGPATYYRLLDAHRSASAVLELAASEAGRRGLFRALAPGRDTTPDAGLVPTDGIAGSRPDNVIAGLAVVARDREAIVARMANRGITWLTLDDPGYPARLRLLEVPPPVLFLRGATDALQAGSAVAIVGTRRPTDGGRRIAARIADALARLDVAIISGLAYGIDGAAHEATVLAGGRTVAVLGSGHERLFPAAHLRLAERIVASGGCLVSELPPEAIPTRGTFPRRNRVISGLADATIVVEAAARSGPDHGGLGNGAGP